MNTNIKALITACDEENIDYTFHHPSKNNVMVHFEKSSMLFSSWTTPINPHSVVQLCVDKDYFYTFFKDVIKMPRTRSYLNPYCNEKYVKYLELQTITDIVGDIEEKHEYPLITKMNKGARGNHVYLNKNKAELEASLLNIFKGCVQRDYVALIQDYISIKKEYRALFLQGELILIYEKETDKAVFTGNLSPLHWEGSRARIIADPLLTQRISDFCAPLFKKLMIPFCGLDIALTEEGDLSLIEANTSPGLDALVKGESLKPAVELYRKILKELNKGLS